MDPYIGEIRMFAGNYAPVGWVFCNGQTLPIVDNDALFNLIGTTYGGDGQTNFAVPDLRGRAPVHVGNGFAIGQQAGSESVTLTVNQLPTHNHTLQFSTAAATQSTPAGNVPAKFTPAGTAVYVDSPATAPMANGSIAPDAGGGQPHENRQPFLCVSFIIATAGVYPHQ
jgi:microcystin-dependent protein